MGAPNTHRRSLLAGLFAVPVVAAAPVIAPSRPNPVPETPGLLDLGEKLAAAESRLRKAIDLKAEAMALYERTRPQLPEELIATPRDRQTGRAEDREVPGDKDQCIYVWRGIRADLIRYDVSRKTKEGKRLRHLARVAKKYEDAEIAALAASGFDDAKQASLAAANEYIALTRDLAEVDGALTADGARIFARALPAFAAALPEAGYVTMITQERHMAIKLAAAFLRLNGEEAAHG